MDFISDDEMAIIKQRRSEQRTTFDDVDRLIQHIAWVHGQLRLAEGALDAVLYERDVQQMTVGLYKVYEAWGGGVGVIVIDGDTESEGGNG